MTSSARPTLIYEDRPPVELPLPAGDAPLVTAGESEATIGWALRPEGMCRSEVCVPVPPDREEELLGARGDVVNVATLAELCGQPVVHDDEHHVWVVGLSAGTHDADAAPGLAADFSLPDLDGVMHRLSDYRGRKVLLVSWASW